MLFRSNKDGYVKILDRIKDMILVSGFNVYPNEIDDVLSDHPKILEAAAVGIEYPDSGEGKLEVPEPKPCQLTAL